MRNYLAIVFNDIGHAYDGLHTLWLLDDDGEVTVHGTTVVHRDRLGQFHVDTKETRPAFATAVGVGVGAMLGLLAGPVGAAAGAGIGAAVGGTLGIVEDLDRADLRGQAAAETRLMLAVGQSAIIADVSEEWTTPIDRRMHALGGQVHRKSRMDLRDDWRCDNTYLYPYEYVPAWGALSL